MASLDYRTEKNAFKKYYSEHVSRMSQAKDVCLSIIASILADEGIEVHSIKGRIKNREEAISKFQRKYRETLEKKEQPYEIKDYISDLIGIRIVILYETEIEKVGELLKREFSVIGVTDKTQVIENGNNTFGYKGLHLDLSFSDLRCQMREYRQFSDLKFEVQIRTIIQDAWSVLDHKIKYKKTIPKYLERRINSLAALFEIADREFISIHQATKREQEQARDQPDIHANLNVFTFHQLLREQLPHFSINEDRIEDILEYILSFGDLSYEMLRNGLQEHMHIINQFLEEINEKLGADFRPDAYMIILHILYLIDPNKYKGIFLSNDNGFLKWYKKRMEPENGSSHS